MKSERVINRFYYVSNKYYYYTLAVITRGFIGVAGVGEKTGTEGEQDGVAQGTAVGVNQTRPSQAAAVVQRFKKER